jgi:iron complex outermembrane receptor protein
MPTFQRKVFSLVIFTLAPAAVLAQSPAPPAAAASAPQDQPAAQPAPASQGAQSITVTGYRGSPNSATVLSNRPVLDTPLSVNSLGKDLLVDQQAISFADVMRNDPSVVLAFPQFDDTLNLRGFYLNIQHREGLPTNAQIRAPFQNKERIDIYKGLAGFRFGFNSPGGVVNSVVKRPTDAFSGTVLFGGDQHGSLYGHLDLGGRFGSDNQFGARVNVFNNDIKSFRNNVEGSQKLVSALLDWRPTRDLTLELDVESMRNVGSVYGVLFGATFGGDVARAKALLPLIEPEMTPAQDWTVEDRWQRLVRVGAKYRLNEHWTLNANAHVVKGDRPYAGGEAQDLQPDGSYALSIYAIDKFTLDYEAASVTLDGRVDLFGLRNDIALGYFGRDERSKGSGGYFFADVSEYLGGTQRGNLFTGATIPGYLPPTTLPGSFAFAFGERAHTGFVNNTVTLSDKVQVLAGVTYASLKAFDPSTGVTGYDDSAVSPIVGLVLKPNAKTSVYASFATGLEQGQTPPVTPTDPTPTPLAPIKSKQVEVGVKHEFGRGALATLALFQIDKGLAYTNAAGAFVQDGVQRHRGIEATVLGRVSSALQLAGGITYLDAKVAKAAENVGKRLPGIGALRYSLFADWRTPWVPGLFLTGGVQGDAKKYVTFANDFSLPGHAIFDVGARYEMNLDGRKLIGRIGVQNLADKRHFESVDFYGGLIFGTSRTVKASVAVEF